MFSGIRAFTRFGYVSQIGFGLLAGAGCAVLLERARSRGARFIIAAALAAGIAADVRQTVRFGFRAELPHPPVEAFLARTNTGGPILHLPLYHSSGDVRWTFASLEHFKPIVNGFSSYVPRRNQELAATLASENIPRATLSLLAEWPVGTLVIHERPLPLDRLRPTMEFAAAGLREVRTRRAAPVRPPGRRRLGLLPAPRIGRQACAREGRRGPGKRTKRSFSARPHGAPHRRASRTRSSRLDRRAQSGQVVHGELKVRGWGQTPGARAEIVEIRIDRDTRTGESFTRTPRPDVATVLPALGACAEAGYEARFPMLPGDDGAHDLHVVFRAADGRMRMISRAFEWAP